MPNVQARYWILTLSCAAFPGPIVMPDGPAWICGQQELGANGFRHWQFIASFSKKTSLRTLRRLWPGCHAEPTRSEAAIAYVQKEDTRVAGTEFEFGIRPIKRNCPKGSIKFDLDWEKIWQCAQNGDLEAIPADVRVHCYRTIRNIAADYAKPVGIERQCFVFWGATGTGKSRRAWDEAGVEAYPKDPRTKFWCGYSGQEHVVVDEFRGGIDISHLLRWLDRYPVIVELKGESGQLILGSSICLRARKIWITSNVNPREWYPELDEPSRDALMRRLVVTRFL